MEEKNRTRQQTVYPFSSPARLSPASSQSSKKGFFFSLRARMLTSFGLLLLAALALVDLALIKGVPFLGYPGEFKKQQNAVFNHLNLVADMKKELFSQWIREKEKDATDYAGNVMLTANLGQYLAMAGEKTAPAIGGSEKIWSDLGKSREYQLILEFLARILAIHQGVSAIDIVDLHTGIILVSTAQEMVGKEMNQKHLLPEVARSGGLFADVEKDDRVLHGVDIEIFRSITPANAAKPEAILIMHLNVEEFIRPLLNVGINLGATGEALLVNKDAKNITSLKYPLADGSQALPLSYQIKAKAAVYAARGDEGIIKTTDYRGVPVLAAYRHISLSPQVGLGLVVKRDQSEVFAPLQNTLIYCFMIAFVMVVGALAVAYGIAQRLSRPIQALSAAATRIAGGDLDARVQVACSNEEGVLADTFNSMVQGLQDWYRELEDTVELRTRQLQEMNRKLHDEIAERQLADQELRENEERYRHLFNNSSDAVMVFDLETLQFEEVNAVAIGLYGYGAQEFLNLKITDISAEKEKTLTIVEKLKSQRHGVKQVPLRYYSRQDGTVFPGEVTLSGFSLAGREKIICSVRDISERTRMEEQLRQFQKLEAIGTLAGGIAHDFNNILTPIIGYTEMTLRGLAAGDQDWSNLQQVLKASLRAKALVQQILAFSRQSVQEPKPLQVHLIVKEALKLLRSSLSANIEIRQNIDSQCGLVLADPVQIHQVIMNLCTNAYQAMRKKGGILAVSLSSVLIEADDGKVSGLELAPGAYLKLEVSDTGHGMDKITQSRIFEPYFTTKEKGEGTGLGLSVVHGIVKSLGGHVTVYSEPEKGTTFRIYLPRLENAAAPSEPLIAEMVPTGTERILLVDDEVSIVELEEKMLERLGYTITSRTSSIETLEAFQAQPHHFDLLITDMAMPKMSGAELARRILAIRADIPIILCTGFSELIDGEKAKELGIRAFIMKPILRDQLAHVIRQVLDEKAQ